MTDYESYKLGFTQINEQPKLYAHYRKSLIRAQGYGALAAMLAFGSFLFFVVYGILIRDFSREMCAAIFVAVMLVGLAWARWQEHSDRVSAVELMLGVKSGARITFRGAVLINGKYAITKEMALRAH